MKRFARWLFWAASLIFSLWWYWPLAVLTCLLFIFTRPENKRWYFLGFLSLIVGYGLANPYTRDLTISILLQVGQMMFYLAFAILQFAAIFWFMSRSKVEVIKPGDPKTVTFADYFGQPNLVALARQVSTTLRDRRLLRVMGGSPLRGILLTGRPGTGKTHLAKALAGEAGIAFVAMEGSGFRGMFWGVDTLKVIWFVSKAKDLAKRYGACCVPGTPVLTDDLRWVPVERLMIGDGILGIEEQPAGEHRKRRTQIGRVEYTGTRIEDLVTVVTDKGEVTVSSEHPFLAHAARGLRGTLYWTSANQLQTGQLIKYLAQPWESESGDSWLAGITDGEGTLIFGRGKGRALAVDITQNFGPVLDRIISECTKRDIPHYVYHSRNTGHVVVSAFPNALKFLGQVRPARLLQKFAELYNGSRPALPQGCWTAVREIKSAGRGEVITLQTSIRTYVANGFVSHNCICFIDEIDAIGASRGGVMGGGQMTGGMMGGGSGALTRLLYEMDGLEELSRKEKIAGKVLRLFGKGLPPRDWHVLFLGSTNRPDVLDSALTRPGRFDKQIEVGMPTRTDREKIIAGYLKKVKHDGKIDISYLAQVVGFATPAMLTMAITRDATRLAFIAGRDCITQRDIEDALQEQAVGIAQPIEDLTDDQKRQVSVHEAGHAVAQHHLMRNEIIARVSIVRRSGALGYMMPTPKHDIYAMPLQDIWADIFVSLMGDIATQIILGEAWTGATADYQAVAERIRYLAISGFWGLKGVWAATSTSGPLPDDAEKAFQQAIEFCRKFAQEHKAEIETLAARLFEVGDLTGEEATAIIKGVHA